MKKFLKNLGKGLKKLGYELVTWGKPIIAKKLKEELVPMLQKKINAGAIDKAVDDEIAKIVDSFCKKYL